MDHEGTNGTICTMLATRMEEKEVAVMLLHCRLGHLSFDKICKAFPDVMCGWIKASYCVMPVSLQNTHRHLILVEVSGVYLLLC
jgi:hypothetical protein